MADHHPATSTPQWMSNVEMLEFIKSIGYRRRKPAPQTIEEAPIVRQRQRRMNYVQPESDS